MNMFAVNPNKGQQEVPSIKKKIMIVIHIGILMYPVKDYAERGLVFSKYRYIFFSNLFFWGSQINYIGP